MSVQASQDPDVIALKAKEISVNVLEVPVDRGSRPARTVASRSFTFVEPRRFDVRIAVRDGELVLTTSVSTGPILDLPTATRVHIRRTADPLGWQVGAFTRDGVPFVLRCLVETAN